MDIRLETWEALIEVLGEFQVVYDLGVEALAWDQKRDAWWVRSQQHGGNSAF